MFRMPDGRVEAMVAAEFLGDPAQLPPVMRDVHGFLRVDARPDNMAVFAAVVVDVEDDSAGCESGMLLFARIYKTTF